MYVIRELRETNGPVQALLVNHSLNIGLELAPKKAIEMILFIYGVAVDLKEGRVNQGESFSRWLA